MWNKRQFGYLFLIAVIFAVSLLISHDFFVIVLLTGLMAGRPIYQSLKKRDTIGWLLQCGLLMAAVLSIVYYVAELLVFPHSPGTYHRVYDAAVTGIGSAVCSLSTAWLEEYKGLPMLNDPPAKN